MCGASRAKNLVKILIALFSSRSITSPHSMQQYVRFHSGMDCRRPHPLQAFEVLRSSRKTSSFPYNGHLYLSISVKVYNPQSLNTARLRCLLRSLCSFMTIWRAERSPTTIVLSTNLWLIRWDALCRLSRCLFRFFCATRLYTLLRWIYLRDFFLHLSRFNRILSSWRLYQRPPLNPST